MGSRFLYNPLKANVRSYFRFNVNSIPEEIKGKAFAITKLLDIKEPLAVKKEQISSNIVLRTVSYGAEKDLLVRPRNCVLFFPHFNSSTEVVEKICSLYHDYGLDVMTVMPKRNHFHFPENGKSLVAELVEKLSGNNLPLHVDKFLVHATSSGSYFYALLSDHLSSSWSGSFNANRIRAQIFDKLTLGDPSSALNVYRSPLPKTFVIGNDYLQQMAVDFANSPLPKETLIYHSFDDTLSSSAKTLIDTWKKRKLDVSVTSWKASGNEDNYLSHPIKYTKALESFLVKIGFA